MNKKITSSYLYAPNAWRDGREYCFYCGISCDDKFQKDDYVKKTFTNRDIVARPASNYVCGCCVEAMAGKANTVQVDGTTKTGRGGSPRMYSWLLSEAGKHAFTKRHLDYARSIVIEPPKPPFSIILSDSGQKQLIFRAPVNWSSEVFSVLLEEKVIDVHFFSFVKYLELATICSAAIGKKQLTDPNSFIAYKSVIDLYGTEENLEKWMEIYASPMGELAAWLCPGKKDARNEYIVSSRIQTEDCRSCGPIERKESGLRGKREEDGDQFLFDFA